MPAEPQRMRNPATLLEAPRERSHNPSAAPDGKRKKRACRAVSFQGVGRQLGKKSAGVNYHGSEPATEHR